MSVDVKLRKVLLSLARQDRETRARLAADGSLFEGYHTEMEAVHTSNAAVLESIVNEGGWPTPERAGADGAEAAWLIVQHAISLPQFQRHHLRLLEDLAAQGKVPAWQPATLLDRIRVLEGRPQVYGTSFDWDEDGNISPLPIEDPKCVDERRARVGLPSLAETLARARTQATGEPKPEDVVERRQRMEHWEKEVGWRD